MRTSICYLITSNFTGRTKRDLTGFPFCIPGFHGGKLFTTLMASSLSLGSPFLTIDANPGGILGSHKIFRGHCCIE
jgi:hypothetical protein